MSITTCLCESLNLGSKAVQLRCIRVSQVRFRRIRSRNPPEPHFERKAMIEVCKPIIPRKEVVCGNLTAVYEERQPHPWNILKAKRLRTALEEAQMILFFHKNSINAENDFLVHNMLFKKELYLQTYISNEVIRLAIKDTFLANATPFTTSRNAIVVSPHQNIATVFSLAKKMPQYLLLAGVIDRTFLSREQLQWLASVPSIQSVQAVTSRLLATPTLGLYGNLNHHQHRLAGLLAEHSKGTSTTNPDSNLTAFDQIAIETKPGSNEDPKA
ncbi:hypothetical protein BIW11_10001 [Tropilaelaps mercedesae]|uniref:Large ribosomal subunit protein uL10m n=1 Tax=Tropilaelaps mercedesae TaxID=418985 RepID=A0A1V9XI25_9ACAR|nr:hypothetical protein BIW11_10001 [Tropilaelaps mercedesae]